MTTTTPKARRGVAIWLFCVAGLIFAMVILGGVTRLTESGLSITDWRPVTGWIPPMSKANWQTEFDRYQSSPQYKDMFPNMKLAQFKTIFWFEYAHRVLGRVIGLAFFIPFVVFLLRRAFDRRMAAWLAVIFALGALQGFVGWYMVSSGLVHRPSVSQYRLTMHLSLAVLIYAAIMWTALGLVRRPVYGAGEPWVDRLRRGAGLVLGMVSITMVAGAFVAGLDAGRYFNTFPLMDGQIVPPGYLAVEPWWLNPFQTIAAVQFDHRVLALTTVATILVFWLVARRARLAASSRIWVNLLVVMALVQATLGIETLLNYVPVWLGSLHQAGALTLFTLALVTLHSLRRARHEAALPSERAPTAEMVANKA